MIAASYTAHCPHCHWRQPAWADGVVIPHRSPAGGFCPGGPGLLATLQCRVCRARLGEAHPHRATCRNEPLQVDVPAVPAPRQATL